MLWLGHSHLGGVAGCGSLSGTDGVVVAGVVSPLEVVTTGNTWSVFCPCDCGLVGESDCALALGVGGVGGAAHGTEFGLVRRRCG